MKQHRFDPISFVFGFIFLLIAVAFALGDQNINLEAWVLPASILFLGIGLMLVTVRGMRSSREDDNALDQ